MYAKLGAEDLILKEYVPEASFKSIEHIFVQVDECLLTLLYYQLLDWMCWFPNVKRLNIISTEFKWDNF